MNSAWLVIAIGVGLRLVIMIGVGLVAGVGVLLWSARQVNEREYRRWWGNRPPAASGSATTPEEYRAFLARSRDPLVVRGAEMFGVSAEDVQRCIDRASESSPSFEEASRKARADIARWRRTGRMPK